MPRRNPDQGVEPFEFRPGLGISRFRGMNRSADPASIPPDQFHLQVNVRLTPAGMLDRPGGNTEYDSLTADCITGMIETGEAQPAAALWTYNDWYWRVGSDYEGYYSAINNNKPLDLPTSPLAVIFSNQGAAPPTTTTELPGKVQCELTAHIANNRVTGAFLFQGKVVELKTFQLKQITDVKRELDVDNSTGKLQFIENIATDAAGPADDGLGDRVVRKEFDGTETRDVLYCPGEDAGIIMRYDGVTVSAITVPAAIDVFATMCLVLGQGLCAIGPTQIAYQANPDAAWTLTAHTYSDGAFDAVNWADNVYFVGRTGALQSDGTDLVRFSPVLGTVVVISASVAGTSSDSIIVRPTSTKQGLLFFHVNESNGPSTTISVGRLSLGSGLELTWLNIGSQQDFSPYLLANIVEIGSRIFYSVDATEEFVWPTGVPAWIFGFDNVGVIFEIGPGPAVLDFYEEYGDDGIPAKTGCPVASMPIGPLALTFGDGGGTLG